MATEARFSQEVVVRAQNDALKSQYTLRYAQGQRYCERRGIKLEYRQALVYEFVRLAGGAISAALLTTR